MSGVPELRRELERAQRDHAKAQTVQYDASAEVIRKYFDEMAAAASEQNTASKMISSLNVEMQEAGVHPGVLSTVRKIEQMPPGKRGYFHFLLRRYLDIRAAKLQDPTFTQPEAKPEDRAVPFGRVHGAAAA